MSDAFFGAHSVGGTWFKSFFSLVTGGKRGELQSFQCLEKAKVIAVGQNVIETVRVEEH